jgi:hypothetical protein
MTSKIRARAENLATFRSISVQLMEILSRWVPTTPEMEAKTLFGRHIWDFAQHADMLGKRTFELRAPLHFTLAPVDSYAALLGEVSTAKSAAGRISSLYDGLLPGLSERYKTYLEVTDSLLDEPSVRIVQRIVTDLGRMTEESRELRAALPHLNFADTSRSAELASHEALIANIVSHPTGDRAGGA